MLGPRTDPHHGSTMKRVLAIALLGIAGSFLAPHAACAAAGAFQTTPNPGGGTIITGTLGNASLSDGAAALLRRVHRQLGNKPAVIQAARSPRDHSVAMIFTAARDGTPYTGIAIVTAAPGAQTGGAALYDTSARFHTTVGTMMRRLNAMTSPAAASAAPSRIAALAPPEKLITHTFSDGTGSIGIPADWKLNVGGGGSASATGPTGEMVAYNMHYSAMDMSNPRAQFFMRSEPPQLRAQYMRTTAMVPYTTDPIKAWIAIFDALGRQNGGAGPQIHVDSQTPSGNLVADATGTIGGKKPMHFIAHVFVLPPNPNGLWSISNSFVVVPDSEIAREATTANAVLNSVRIDFGAVAAQGAEIRKVFQAKFDAMLATSRAQTAARTQRVAQAMATDRAAQENMHKQAVAMENYSLDRAVVVNTSTGVHDTISSTFADTLVKANPNYQKVPAQNLLRGIDY